MNTKEREYTEADRYITAGDLTDDLARFVEEYYCGRVQRCDGGFILTDLNGKTYEVSVKTGA